MSLAVGADLSQRLVPDDLRELVAPLPPSFTSRPQGGGTAPRDERAVFTAVVYVLTSGCAWRHLPGTFGVSPATAHRRFAAWTKAGLWRRLHRAVLDGLSARGELDWTSAIVDTASVRARKGGALTGPSPVDRGRKGSELHVLSEVRGIPLAVAVSVANTHDSQPLKPLIRGIPAIRSRRGPRRGRPVKLRADKAYFSADHLLAPTQPLVREMSNPYAVYASIAPTMPAPASRGISRPYRSNGRISALARLGRRGS